MCNGAHALERGCRSRWLQSGGGGGPQMISAGRKTNGKQLCLIHTFAWSSNLIRPFAPRINTLDSSEHVCDESHLVVEPRLTLRAVDARGGVVSCGHECRRDQNGASTRIIRVLR